MAASNTALVTRTHTKKHASTPTSTHTHTHTHAHTHTPTHTHTHSSTAFISSQLFRRNDLYLFQEKILILEKWSFSRARSTTFFQDQHKSEKRGNKVLSNQHLLEKTAVVTFLKTNLKRIKKGFIFDFLVPMKSKRETLQEILDLRWRYSIFWFTLSDLLAR